MYCGCYADPGLQLKSLNGEFKLVFETNGDLVEYTRGKSIWSTATFDKGKPARFSAQPDGDLVVYSKDR
mgnify:CR=1 FL=1